MSKPKITVIVITYNQERDISRAIESLLVQSKWLYEVIICDDCSSDNTWNVISKYHELNPKFIKIHRNERNFGLFENWEQTWSMPSGDFMYLLAGDDYVNDGLFYNVHKLIDEYNINYSTEAIALYFDFMTLYPNGNKIITSNSLITKGFDPLSLKLRDFIYPRTVVVSRMIFENYKPIDKSIGIYADMLIHIQTPFLAQKVYYCPFVGNVYVYGVGVASKTNQVDHWNSLILALNELKCTYKFNKKDIYWIDYKVSLFRYFISPTLKKYILIWYNYIKSLNFKYSIDFKNPIRLILRLSKLINR